MTMRRTPYLRLRYPWASDVVSATDVQTEAADIDQALVNTDAWQVEYARMSSACVSRAAVQSITKGTLTAVTFDTVRLDNGANGPAANGAWYAAGTPTRLTAPSACVVLAYGFCGISTSGALGTNGYLEVAVTLNGGTGQPNYQGTKWNPVSTFVGQMWAEVPSMWKLAAGDYLELKVKWGGTPAGPFNTDNALEPHLTVCMVALPSVP